jgi:hypothetical protein
MPLTKGTRRALLSRNRALQFCLGLWLGPTVTGVPALDLMLGFELAVGSPVLDAPEIGTA